MSQIRWDELSEARQLARLGKKLSRSVQTRLQWLLSYLCKGRNVARTCRHFGISRQTFYRWWRRFDRHDLSMLEERSHRPHCVRPHQSLVYLTPLEFVTRWKRNLRKAKCH